MIPTRTLVIASLLPLVLAVIAVLIPALVVPMLVVDLAILAVAAADARTARGAVEVTRAVGAVQAVGRPFEVTVQVRNTGARRLRLRLTDDAPGEPVGLPASLDLAPGARGEVTYGLVVDERGQARFGPVTLRWASALGLWERQHRRSVDTALRVYPNFEPLRRYGLDASLSAQRAPLRVRRRPGGENEFERLRPYVPGDPYKHIDWKATARRREFTTREFGQEANQNVIFLLDAGRMMSARSGALTAFDHALNAAIRMGQVALRHGDRVGLLVFDSQIRAWLPPRGGARSAGRLIRATYDLQPTLDEPDYALAFRHLAQRVRRRSLVVLLTAVVDEVNAELANTLVAALSGRHLAISVWLRDTDVDEALARPAAGPVDVWTRAAAAELLGWRDQALSGLKRRGAWVVDCAPSQLSPELLGRYLEIKARRML